MWLINGELKAATVTGAAFWVQAVPIMILDLSRPSDLNLLADALAERMKAQLASAEPEHIMFKEAMETLGIGYSALQRRIKASGVKTYWRNDGKAFDRKHLNKLR